VAADAARAPWIIGVFTVLGVSAAVMVRNALASSALAGGVLIASLTAAGNLSAIAPWTLAYWVAGWMQFRPHGYVIYHFWVDGFPASLHSPGFFTGFIGLLVVTTAVAVAAVAIFRHIDVST
jgi:hypothetical protein